MDGSSHTRSSRGRGYASHDGGSSRGRPHSRNKHWSAADGNSTPMNSDSERWERGGHRGKGRGREFTRGVKAKFHNVSIRLNHSPSRSPQPKREAVARQPVHQLETLKDQEVDDAYEGDDDSHTETEYMGPEIGEGGLFPVIHEPELETPEEREKFYQELVKAREQERKTAIAEGKMDDPLVAKRLEDAISIVGTCMDMCPRFERYRRERENNLFEWETIPGTKRIDHNRAVKMYERAAGDKTLPSDLRPPEVLKRTLDYLFCELLPRGGFSATFNFIRDRSRAVRNDFTMQHITGPLAIECHDRCARFHILALHFERDRPSFSIPLEEQQLMNTLQSLKEFYEDQRGRYESATELEMRVYHRLIHIRDQKERHEDIPDCITSHPVFKLTTAFRLHVQEKSAPISKSSKLVVTDEGMQIFSQLAMVLKEQGSTVMVYLVACLLERLFGKDTIDDIEVIRGDLSISDVINGVSSDDRLLEVHDNHVDQQVEEIVGDEEDENQENDEHYGEGDDEEDGEYADEAGQELEEEQLVPQSLEPISFRPITNATAVPQATQTAISTPAATSAFGGLISKPNPFGIQSVFGGSTFGPASGTTSSIFSAPVFGNVSGSVSASATTSVSTRPPHQSSFVSHFALSSSTGVPSANVFNAESVISTTPDGSPVRPQESPHPKPPISVFGDAKVSPPAASLNPQAPEFTPPFKSSTFSQSLKSPTNGSRRSILQPDLSPSPAPASQYGVADTKPSLQGAILFGTISSSAEPQPSLFNFSKPGHHSSKSLTPPFNRPVPPPILKINTNTSSSSSGSGSSVVASPAAPPPMPKIQPISLPSTPTTVLQPQNALLGHLRNTLEGSSSSHFSSPTSSSQDVLSPLVMGSPTTSCPKPFHNFTPLSTPKTLRRFSAASPPSSARKGKKPELPSYDVDEVEEMKKKALEFAQKGVIVRKAFKRWVQSATDRAAYLEARKHDEEYREKLQLSRGADGVGSHTSSINGHMNHTGRGMDKRRRVSTNGLAVGEHELSPMKKRARKRMLATYRPPRTDDELAERFKENHKEHEFRWAKGTFLQVTRKHISKINAATLKMPWSIWLSMNPESDATAIWLERKFDVPESGSWASEFTFSIPLSSISDSKGVAYPGLIIFEATPLAGVSDELERKYRVLDDCSRLRDIVKSLSSKRHFIPSLLVISWDAADEFSTSDFGVMVSRLVAESVMQNFSVFSITTATKDLDNKFDAVLNTLNLDTDGKLVRTLSADGCFKLFSPAFDLFLTEWMESCSANGRFNWTLYMQLVQASITLLNTISNSIQSLLELSGPGVILPEFNYEISDSESCYDSVNDWLLKLSFSDESRFIATDMHSHRNVGQEFPGRVFIDCLVQLTKTRIRQLYPHVATAEHAILISKINTSLESLQEAILPLQLILSQTYNFTARRSPKRRAQSTTTSELGSPEAKRPRLLASIASTDGDDFEPEVARTLSATPTMNGNLHPRSPSPTGSTVSAALTDRTAEHEVPQVTLAMLRALTRDIKKKYAVGYS